MSEDTVSDGDFSNALEASRRIMCEAVQVLAKATYDLEDLEMRLTIAWRAFDQEAEELEFDTAAALRALRNAVAEAATSAAQQEQSVMAKMVSKYPHLAGSIRSNSTPAIGSAAYALLALIKLGSTIVVQPRGDLEAVSYQVTRDLFILRVLGWQIDRWECTGGDNHLYAYAIADEYAPVCSHAGHSPVFIMEEREGD